MATFTSVVASFPSGSASRTDCGIIPALASAVAPDLRPVRRKQGKERERTENDEEADGTPEVGAIVAHGEALRVLRELEGMKILTQRLDDEAGSISSPRMPRDGNGLRRRLQASCRVKILLLFLIRERLIGSDNALHQIIGFDTMLSCQML